MTSAGWAFVLRADQVSPYEARAKLGGQLRRVAGAAATDARSDGLASAVSRVVDVHNQGALTDAEFTEAKRRILQGE